MIVLLFVIHVAIALALVGSVLLQKSEGGALGIGGGGGMSGFMTGRSTANLLTRTTAILAAAFFVTSVLLVVLSNRTQAQRSLLDQPPPGDPEAPGGSRAAAGPGAGAHAARAEPAAAEIDFGRIGRSSAFVRVLTPLPPTAPVPPGAGERRRDLLGRDSESDVNYLIDRVFISACRGRELPV